MVREAGHQLQTARPRKEKAAGVWVCRSGKQRLPRYFPQMKKPPIGGNHSDSGRR
jgi:hypothetical protein